MVHGDARLPLCEWLSAHRAHACARTHKHTHTLTRGPLRAVRPQPTLGIAQRAFEDLAIKGAINYDVLAAQVGEGGAELAAFLKHMLAPDPAHRASADALLADKFFDDVRAECREHFGSELP